ncbi:YncE family protein [Streptomyces katsurahamanus]|uniref:YncE family protein n=1 Tax=Streptomyces katsurahamanus TaxID=2577098 RepID=A0ABW9NVW1_9ACTN|nr:YncE family protein [Streptomyces katsurahamanus]MQS37445.1 YncE family protein [Streptomyces katsurahamanus]
MAAALLLMAGLTVTSPARAADPGEATGPTGQKLTVSATKDIDPAGQRITATGSGYDPKQGVYLAVCVIQKAGQAPSPCLGGIDFSGASGSAVWISNNPPDYAEDLVKPFTVKDGKGSFSFDLTVKIKDSSADCTQQACAVVTRADHTDAGDRDQDVIVPITFGSTTPTSPEAPPGTVRHTEVRKISLPDAGLQDAKVDPAARRLYVSSIKGTKPQLTTYDTVTGAMVGEPVELPGVAGTLALDADSSTLFLGLDDRVAAYDTTTGRLLDNRTPTAKLGVGLLAADPAADRLYVANKDRDKPTVTVYDTKKWKAVGEPAPIAFPAYGLTVDTKRHIGYAVHVGSTPNPSGPNTISNTLDAIDGATGKLASTLSIGTTALGSQGVAVDSGTGTGYVANLAANSVSIVDLEANKIVGSVSVGGNPKALAYDSGTGTLYAAQTTAGTVAVVDPAKHKVVQVLETGRRSNVLTLDDTHHTLFTVSAGTSTVVQTQRQVSPRMTAQPRTVSVEAGKKAEFTAAAEATPAASATWEVSTDDGKVWQPIGGSLGAEFSFTAHVEHDGNQYRAVFSNPVGSTRSDPVELTVTAPPTPSPSPSPGDPDPGGSGGSTAGGGTSGSGTTTGGTTTGGTATGGGTDGSAGGGGTAGGSTGGVSGGGTAGGALASTGSTMLPYAIGAAVLTALGAAALILRRRVRTPGPALRTPPG